MNEELIIAVVASAISIALEVVPGLRNWWDKIPNKQVKSLVVFLACLVIPLGAVGLKCLGVDVGLGAACPNPADPQLWVNALVLGLTAFLSASASYKYIGQPLGDRIKAHG